MAFRDRMLPVLTFVSRPLVAIGGAVLIGGGALALVWFSMDTHPSGSYVKASIGPITEEVDVTGTVKAAQNADLSFQIGGQVAAIRVAVGDHVGAGQTLVVLGNESQAAAVAVAKANLETQNARLAALTAGTRPEQLAIDQTAVTQDEAAVINAITSAYAAADTAVHTDADQFFTNPRTPSAALPSIIPDATLANRVVQERIALEPMFADWSAQIAAPSSSTSDPLAAASQATEDLSQTGTFLNDLAAALSKAQPTASQPAATLSSYESTIAAARTSITNALSALTAAQTALASAQGTLTLAQAGSTSQDIAAQQALVDGASASLSVAEVAVGQTYLSAPVAGIIAAQNAVLGETVAPEQPLISMIADGKYQADAQVSEADIAKLKVGDAVEATFSAYPSIVFPATLSAVAPAATVENGVSSYKITVTFAQNDPRVVAGLSANLRIITQTKNAALLVPQSAIITNGTKQFVYVENAKGSVETPVVVGIESASGSAEIVSGLSAGDEVLSFGLSAQAGTGATR